MAERKKKVPFGYFFQFYVLLKRTASLLIVCECRLDVVLRGRRTKGLRCRPFVNTRNQRKYPLDSSAFGGLGLGASDRQRFARGRPFGRD